VTLGRTVLTALFLRNTGFKKVAIQNTDFGQNIINCLNALLSMPVSRVAFGNGLDSDGYCIQADGRRG